MYSSDIDKFVSVIVPAIIKFTFPLSLPFPMSS
jgi:hypothetical protein